MVKGEEDILESVVRAVVQRSFMGWWCEEALEVAEWRGGGSFT